MILFGFGCIVGFAVAILMVVALLFQNGVYGVDHSCDRDLGGS